MEHLPIEQVREKYMKLIQTKGLDEAITQLHREIGSLEPKVFTGGFEKDRIEYLTQMRDLARDIFNYQLEQDSMKYYE